MRFVRKGVVVGEFDERLRPDRFDAMDLVDHAGHWLYFEARRNPDRRAAELAIEWTTPLRLHGEAVVLLDVEQLEARHRRIGEIEAERTRVIQHIESICLEVRDHARPEWLAFAHDHSVGVLGGFVRNRTDMQSAENDLRADGAVTVGELVGLFDLRAEARDRDNIKIAGQPWRRMDVGHVDVFESDISGRRAGERQKAEARKRGDDAIAFDESGKCQAERSELRVVRTDTTHGEKTEFHATNQPPISPPSPTSTAATGIGKR